MKNFWSDLQKLKAELRKQKETTAKVVVFIYRLGYFAEYKTHGLLKKVLLIFWYILDSFITKLFFNTIIPRHAQIGEGLMLSHPFGIIMARNVKIGKNARIRHQVTIGRKDPDNPAVAVIGDNVTIGAGAKLIGPVTIGNNATIGINAVVTKSFQDNSILVGIPAQNIAEQS